MQGLPVWPPTRELYSEDPRSGDGHQAIRADTPCPPADRQAAEPPQCGWRPTRTCICLREELAELLQPRVRRWLPFAPTICPEYSFGLLPARMASAQER